MAHNPNAMETDESDKNKDKDVDMNNQASHLGDRPMVNPLVVIQAKLEEFVSEIKAAEDDAKKMDKEHTKEQEALMKEFTMKSLQLMHKYNCQIKPIQKKLSNVKQPLVDVLLNKCVSIPCNALEQIQKKQTQIRGYATSGWGQSSYGYSSGNSTSKNTVKELNTFDLGIDFGNSSNNDNNNNNSNDNQDSAVTTSNNKENNDTSMENDKSEDKSNSEEMDGKDRKIANHLSNAENMNATQVDIMLKYFQKMIMESKREEQARLAEIRRKEMEMKREEQRLAAANNLIEIIPWLTLEQATIVMKMKDDNVEAASNFVMQSDPTDLMLTISEHKKSEEKVKNLKKKNDDNNSNNKNNNDNSKKDNELTDTDLAMLNKLDDVRHHADKRVLQRSTSTGMVKFVTFRVIEVLDDGTIVMRGLLDRNLIPLDPTKARLLKLSLPQLVESEFSLMDETIVLNYIKSRVLKIVFQVHDPSKQQAYGLSSMTGGDISALMQNFEIPDELLLSGNMDKINEFAQKMMADQQRQMNAARYGSNTEIEFVPISYIPEVRVQEYKLEFDDGSNPSDKCLKNVTHHVDGSVLFTGVFDDQTGMLLHASSQPIEIYSQALDDVTHNILCVLLDNDIRSDITVDSKNLSFTDHTLDSLKKDSISDFNKKDATGRKLSYRIVVKNKKIIGVLSMVGNEMKEIAFIEHSVPSPGSLVIIDKGYGSKKWAIVKNLPTGLIVTNDPHKDLDKKRLEYNKNGNSFISRKHVADLEGYIDCDVIREEKQGMQGNESKAMEIDNDNENDNDDEWRIDNPIKEAYAVTDIKVANETQTTHFIQYKTKSKTKLEDTIKDVITQIENDFAQITNKNQNKNNNDNNDNSNGKTKKELWDDARIQVNKLKELKSKLEKKNDASKQAFINEISEKITKFEREVRALRFEVNMTQ